MSEEKCEWKLFFDGSCSKTSRLGAGIVIENPTGQQESYFKDLRLELICNQSEYAALITGLEIARGQQIEHLKVLGDSKLVCKQVTGDWEVKSDRLAPYHEKAVDITKSFKKLQINHIPREQNYLANDLSRLARSKIQH
jgi:ribonuclease HI